MSSATMRALRALVRKDLKLFFGDRRSVIVSFLVPIAIASFFGALFRGSGDKSAPARIEVAIVDHDSSTISRAIVTAIAGDKALRVTSPGDSAARDAVRRGKIAVALVLPRGFGDSAGQAFFGAADRPTLDLLYDPSRAADLAMVRGIMTEHVMQAVSAEMFGGGQQGRAIVERTLPRVAASNLPADEKARLLGMLTSVQAYFNAPASGSSAGRGISMPYTARETPVTSGPAVAYNSYAHSFAGMAIQFLLFAMANMGVEMLLERKRGLWQRLRSAPISKRTLLMSKAVSGALISLLVLVVSFAFAMIVFHVRIQGSIIGFVAIAIACSFMASTFGLLVAALGNTPATARGVTTFGVLIMVMLGGAWVPAFIFPAWLQQATKVIPVRWAVDGFDAMTWRGIGISGAWAPVLVLTAFALLFGVSAMARFKWQEA